MGQEASTPKPGAKFRVIGAGLPRTGTTSLSTALEILLDGPVYHGGTQVLMGPPNKMGEWIEVLERLPSQEVADREHVLKHVKQEFDGYVGTTDGPGFILVPELLEQYPEAKVICTVRDADGWARSIEQTAGNATMWFLGALLLPLPGLRHAPRYVKATANGRYGELFVRPGEQPFARPVYDRHIQWLKEVVPEDRLVFFDVKDGWGPLCKALEVEAPKGVPFPRVNDADAMEEFVQQVLIRGVKAWAKIVGACAIIGGISYAAINRG